MWSASAANAGAPKPAPLEVPVPVSKEVDRDVAHQQLAHYEAYVKEARAPGARLSPLWRACALPVRRSAAIIPTEAPVYAPAQRAACQMTTAVCSRLMFAPARLTESLTTLPHPTVAQAKFRKDKQDAALLRPRTARRAPAASAEHEEAGAERPSSAGHASDVDGAVLPSVCHDTLPGQRKLSSNQAAVSESL